MDQVPQSPGGGGVVGIIVMVVQLAILVLVIVSFWKVFVKAGKPGWAVIVPIYNIVVLLQIANKPVWWLILFFIPLVNLVMAILLGIAVAEAFGKGTGFGVGLALLGIIFYPILGFGDAQYQGGGGTPVPA